MKKLQADSFNGIPTESFKGLRPLIWRLILGALPKNTKEWQNELDKNFNTYEDFKKELIVKPKLKDEEAKKER